MFEFFNNRRIGYALGAVVICALIVIIVRGQKQCLEDNTEKEKFLLIIHNNQNQIEQIRLSKSAPGWKVNLIDKEVVIKDTYKIDSIRNYVVYRKHVDGKERIVSGSFASMPSFILVYKNPFHWLKTISPVDVFVKILWMFANLCVLAVIKIFRCRYPL